MEKLLLLRPDRTYAGQIKAYRQEFLDKGDSMDGCGSLRRWENADDWLADVAALAQRETVPSTQFICVRASDQRLVGMLDVRHSFNEYLEKYAGNIGYSVRPSERRKGYGTRMLGDCLPYCRQLGLEKVLISCTDSNEASRRIILANGGVYESTVLEPKEHIRLERYWITL